MRTAGSLYARILIPTLSKYLTRLENHPSFIWIIYLTCKVAFIQLNPANARSMSHLRVSNFTLEKIT